MTEEEQRFVFDSREVVTLSEVRESEIEQFDPERICKAFGVPPWIVGVSDPPRRFSLRRLKWWWRCRGANAAAADIYADVHFYRDEIHAVIALELEGVRCPSTFDGGAYLRQCIRRHRTAMRGSPSSDE